MRTLATLPLAMFVCAVLFAGVVPAQSSAANLLVIVADDLGPETVGCYQHASIAANTPVLDGLAQTGIRFNRAYANPSCSPTRACIQTGRYAFRTGMTASLAPWDPGLRDEELLLPELLATSNYATAMIGKWHLGVRHGASTPNVQGWPHFVGSLDLGLLSYDFWLKVDNGNYSFCSHYATSDNVDEALAWITRQNQPWMLMLCFQAPHWPLHAPPAALHSQALTGLDPLRQPIPFYKAMVEAMDTEIGRLLQGLGSGLANTNVVFVADNGTPAYVLQTPAPAGRGKGSTYEGGVRVPMIVSGPAVVRPGRTSDELVSMVDLYPTCLELCGIPLPSQSLDGVSVVPILNDQTGPVRPWVFNETIPPFGQASTSLTFPDFKLIRFTGSRRVPPHEELYDLSVDPYELNDLLATAPQQALVQQQLARLTTTIAPIRGDGWVLAYGSDCAGAFGTAQQSVADAPGLGRPYEVTVDYDTPTPDFVITLVGASKDLGPQGPLPIDLGTVGMPGCQLLTSSDAVVYLGLSGSSFRMNIPSFPQLLWSGFYLQSFAVDAGANATGLITSSGLECTIGH